MIASENCNLKGVVVRRGTPEYDMVLEEYRKL
jgi:hypothetical protein